MFLSYPELDNLSGKCHNTLFAIDQGKLAGRHRKIEVHPGAEESWSSPGEATEPVMVGGVNVGMLICADTWDSSLGVKLAEKEAQLLIVSTAWGHTYPPLEHWKKLSLDPKLPVWVCNRTGQERNVDWTRAESMVILKGEPVFRYSGEPAVLLFDWDMDLMASESTAFKIVTVAQ